MCGEVLIPTDHSQHGRNIDDHTMPLSQHGVQGIFATIKNTIEIQVQRCIPAFECARVNRSITPFTSASACHVDEDIKTAMCVNHVFDCGFDFGCRGHIHAQ